MSKIIGFCGEKTSGKSTIANVFTLVALQRYNLGSDLKIDAKTGKIIHDGKPVDPNHLNTDIVKQYALADSLKEICVNVLGLDYQGVYGSDDDKSKLTNYYWEDMPGVITNKKTYIAVERLFSNNNWREPSWPWMYHKRGQMSNREVMQFIGSDIFRKINPQVWISCTMRKINMENPEYALITDARFPNEVIAFAKKGTMVGLTKKSKDSDTHISEKVYLEGCKYLIENQDANDVKDLIECIYNTFGKNKDLLSI